MAWREIPQVELGDWNQRLLREPSSSIRQYPLFNEGLRTSGGLWVTTGKRYASLIATARRWTTGPRYLQHQSADGKTTFVCIVTIGVPGFRVGCILDGPMTLGCPIEMSAIADLLTWARRNHYVALRVTHSNEAFLQSLSGMGPSDRIDGVPFYPHPSSELVVTLSPDEAAMLSSFQKVARQEIRKASEAGYDISVDQDPRALEKAWPAFISRSAQKGITYRALETYTTMMRAAAPHNAAHLYSAWREGKPVAAILILRDGSTAHYFLGTVDADALGDAPSPACLLHWKAMRDAVARGASFYNMGTRSGTVYSFKAKFRPVEHDRPAPLTFFVRPGFYKIWRRLLPSVSGIVS